MTTRPPRGGDSNGWDVVVGQDAFVHGDHSGCRPEKRILEMTFLV